VNQGVTVNQELGRRRIKQMFGAIGPGRRGGKSSLASANLINRFHMIWLTFVPRTCGGLAVWDVTPAAVKVRPTDVWGLGEWSVKGTDHNEDVLMDIFKNGKSCLTMVKSQLQLF